jgi:1-acyl-sn-glycerol-3-phosphate acyltransferase
MWPRIRAFFLWSAIALVTCAFYPPDILTALLWLPFDATRPVGHFWARQWARLIIWINPAWSVELSGARLPRGRHFVVVSNHESMADIIVDLHLPLHFKFISKESNFKVPVLGWGMSLAGYLPLRRGQRSSIERCMARARWCLDHGVSVLFYPEGTRSLDGALLPFKAGAFRLAIESGVDVLPIATTGSRDALPKNSLVFSSEKNPMRLVVGTPIPVKGLTLDDVQSLSDRTRAAIIALGGGHEPALELRKAS